MSNRNTDDGVKQYHRRISVDNWQEMPGNPLRRVVVSVDGFDRSIWRVNQITCRSLLQYQELTIF